MSKDSKKRAFRFGEPAEGVLSGVKFAFIRSGRMFQVFRVREKRATLESQKECVPINRPGDIQGHKRKPCQCPSEVPAIKRTTVELEVGSKKSFLIFL